MLDRRENPAANGPPIRSTKVHITYGGPSRAMLRLKKAGAGAAP